MPLSENGFVARTENELIKQTEQELALVQDPDSGEFLQPDFSSDDPVMQAVLVPISAISQIEYETKLVYDQFNPDQNTGASQSGMVKLNGLRRLDELQTVVDVDLAGSRGTLIPAGSKFSRQDDEFVFSTDFDVVLDAGGQGSTTATAINYGEYRPENGDLNKIITPIGGWDSIINTETIIVGREVETDEELRIRRDASTSAPSVSVVDGLYSNLLQIDGVKYARCYQNLSPSETDARGIPPATLSCVVDGGLDEDIAKCIFTRYSMINTHGNTTVSFTDLQGEGYPISFFRPTKVPIWVRVSYSIYNEALFPPDGEEQIAEAVLAYATGGAKALGITDGFESGFNVGSTVEPTRLYTPCNMIPGHRCEIEVSSNGTTFTELPLDIGFLEVSDFALSRITVQRV